ncbi:MAG: MinD/ParA family protein [bacterium]|nr:MinD/ParA family protein [bacterium]
MSRIIPIAAGKGGVGKTFLAANLSIALAEAGHSVTAVDLDLGGSNLHSHLGVSNTHSGVGDFLKARSVEFSDLPVPTGIEGLSLIPGDGKSAFMANIPFARKKRLISHLLKLDSEYIVLDLGAGASFNTLDFFALSDHGLLVTQPEYPALMNMLSFLKQFLLRRIERETREHDDVREFMATYHKRSIEANETSIAALQQEIGTIDREAGARVEAITRRYRPRIVFNMGYSSDEMGVAAKIQEAAREHLSLELDFFGFVFHDRSVHRAIAERQPFLPSKRKSISAAGILRTAQRIRTFWDRSVNDSARRVEVDARRTHAAFRLAPAPGRKIRREPSQHVYVKAEFAKDRSIAPPETNDGPRFQARHDHQRRSSSS